MAYLTEEFLILMIRSLIEGIVDTMNAFPSEGSVSETLSPSTVVEGKPKLDLSKYIIVFGAYALVYTDTNNSMKSRAVPDIALRRSNNADGHYFMNLYSGKRIHGYKWRELPIDDYVISRAEELAEAEKQPIMHDGEPNFEWGPGETIEEIGEPIEEIDENEEAGTLTIAIQMEDMQDYDHIENDHMNNNNEMNDYIPMIEDENNDELPINNNNEDDNLNDIVNHNNEEGLDAVIEDNIISDEDDTFDPIDEEIEENTDYCNQGEDNHEEDVAVVANIDDEPQPEPVNQYMSDRPRRTGAGAGVERLQLDPNKKGYREKREFNLMNNGVLNKKNSNIDKIEHMMMQIAYDVIFTQMSSKLELKKYAQIPAKQGIKLFGQVAVAAMIKEFSQLNQGAVPGKPVVVSVDVKTLTPLGKKALPAVNLIKEKRSGDIKGRTCVNGSKQRRYLKQDESVSSPTAVLESLVATLLIDAYEQRDVAIYDISGVFL